MEKNLDRVMEEVVSQPGVFGCVFVDHQGLCLGAKGKASTESAGLIAAIAEQAAKLEPHSGAPIIALENDDKTCIIQRTGTITGAIYKNKHS
ncbi:ragulator complex protein LAMTOR5 -like protein [Asbolus verrucosus]|uniref:Late endosomal/lysosomal adaptor and MAPK and MTOR activator 5 n=1 Tax=Asbolus verrucosus TaxID=1661398 RepID=A0A482WA79_ASBVE|nr:ragulator complex protein LAMTOR5 -like protein [Asbolus verrucosus]